MPSSTRGKQKASTARHDDDENEVRNGVDSSESDESDAEAEGSDPDEAGAQKEWSAHVTASTASWLGEMGLKKLAGDSNVVSARAIAGAVEPAVEEKIGNRKFVKGWLKTVKRVFAEEKSIVAAVGAHYGKLFDRVYAAGEPRELKAVRAALRGLAASKADYHLVSAFPDLYGSNGRSSARAAIKATGNKPDFFAEIGRFIVIYAPVLYTSPAPGQAPLVLRPNGDVIGDLDADSLEALQKLANAMVATCEPTATPAQRGSGSSSANRNKKSPQETALLLRMFEAIVSPGEKSEDIHSMMVRSMTHKNDFELARQVGDRWTKVCDMVADPDFEPLARWQHLDVPGLGTPPTDQYVLKNGKDAEDLWTKFRAAVNRANIAYNRSGNNDPSVAAATEEPDDDDEGEGQGAAAPAAAAGAALAGYAAYAEGGANAAGATYANFCDRAPFAAEAIEYVLRALQGEDANDRGLQGKASALLSQTAGAAIPIHDDGDNDERESPARKRRRGKPIEVTLRMLEGPEAPAAASSSPHTASASAAMESFMHGVGQHHEQEAREQAARAERMVEEGRAAKYKTVEAIIDLLLKARQLDDDNLVEMLTKRLDEAKKTI